MNFNKSGQAFQEVEDFELFKLFNSLRIWNTVYLRSVDISATDYVIGLLYGFTRFCGRGWGGAGRRLKAVSSEIICNHSVTVFRALQHISVLSGYYNNTLPVELCTG
jgi:hypothetical protein